MPMLMPGSTAPEITLTSPSGSSFSLGKQSETTPIVAAFFKVSCPTCQYAFPFLERIHRAYPQHKIKVVGISQDDNAKTATFTKEFGISFPMLLDDAKSYPASNAFGLTNVPSIFLLAAGGKVEFTSVGWVREDIERLNELAAKAAGVTAAQIFGQDEDVKAFKAA
jgi:peroxiredoxin